MSEADLPQILELEQKCFPDSPWPEKEFLYELHENPFSCVQVLEKDGKIVGYIDWWIEACIRDANEKECETLSLEARVSNTPAISLYHSYGFIDAAIRKRYYENGEDAILMVLPLGGSL